MQDVQRYRKDHICIVQNYQLLRMEKSQLAEKEQEARVKYMKYKNNNKILNGELGE